MTTTAAQLFDLKGRVALVTGASSGLGVRFAEVLAREGAAVALVARRKEKLAAVQARIEQAGGRAVAIAADVLDRAAMTRAFDEAETAFGTVTILVNNAGVAHANRAVDLPAEEWRRVLGTNLDAVFFWAQEAARRMLGGEAGRRHRQHRLGARLRRRQGHGGLCGGEGRHRPAHQGARARARLPGHPRQCHRAGLDRDRSQPRISRRASRARRSSARSPSVASARKRDLDGALLLLVSDAGRFIAGTTIVVDGGQMVRLRG